MLPNKIVLEGVEPFNEIFYKSCYYSSFFPIIQFFKRGPYNVLLAESFRYKLEDQFDFITYENFEKKDIIELMEDYGILADGKNETDDIIEEVARALSQNRLVIVTVDCYYLSIRAEAYLKQHFLHMFLVYGIDKEQKTVNIIEHKYKDSYIYEKRVISFEDLINSFNGCSANSLVTIGMFPLFQEYLLNPESDYHEISLDEARALFKQNMLDDRDLILDSYKEFSNFLNRVEGNFRNEEYLKNNIEPLIESLIMTIQNKQLEKYRLMKLFGHQQELINKLDEIINIWVVIRGYLGKYKYAGAFSEKALSITISKFKYIYEQEINFLEDLYSFIEQI